MILLSNITETKRGPDFSKFASLIQSFGQLSEVSHSYPKVKIWDCLEEIGINNLTSFQTEVTVL